MGSSRDLSSAEKADRAAAANAGSTLESLGSFFTSIVKTAVENLQKNSFGSRKDSDGNPCGGGIPCSKRAQAQ